MKKRNILILIIIGLLFVTGFYYIWRMSDKSLTGVSNCTNHCINIVGAVVPHHNLVAVPRAEFFSNMAKSIKTPKTIILLSPNHYNVGYGHIQTTDQVWNLINGQIQPNSQVISSLVSNKLVTIEPSSFIDEHGVYNILDDIKKNFPTSTIVPLIFQYTSMTEITALEKHLKESCDSCLMIASVDFSHYQPALLAQLHDDKSIRDLDTLNTEDIYTDAELDSGSSVALLTLWASDHNANNFVLKNHTNSDIINGNTDAESTTHVFGWYQSGTQTVPEKSVNFIVGGDTMFARMINYKFGTDFNNAFANFGDRVFWGTDAAIINLEGAISNKPIQKNFSTTSMTFIFSPIIAKTLSFLHINAVSQSNNHSGNDGSGGVSTTRSVLNTADIQTFGGPNKADISNVAVFHGSGLSLTIIGIDMLIPGQSAEALVPLIKNLKSDPTMRVMVMPHWGVEYNLGHTTSQTADAHVWVDAGADIIIGSHPHVIEDSELYNGVPIIYSLGNLLFDQYFSKETQEGLLIAGTFTSDGLTFFGLPTQSIKYQPQLMTGYEKKKILDSIYIPFNNYLKTTPAGTIVQIIK